MGKNKMAKNKRKKYYIIDEEGKIVSSFRLIGSAKAMLRYYRKNFHDKFLKIVQLENECKPHS